MLHNIIVLWIYDNGISLLYLFCNRGWRLGRVWNLWPAAARRVLTLWNNHRYHIRVLRIIICTVIYLHNICIMYISIYIYIAALLGDRWVLSRYLVAVSCYIHIFIYIFIPNTIYRYITILPIRRAAVV